MPEEAWQPGSRSTTQYIVWIQTNHQTNSPGSDHPLDRAWVQTNYQTRSLGPDHPHDTCSMGPDSRPTTQHSLGPDQSPGTQPGSRPITRHNATSWSSHLLTGLQTHELWCQFSHDSFIRECPQCAVPLSFIQRGRILPVLSARCQGGRMMCPGVNHNSDHCVASLHSCRKPGPKHFRYASQPIIYAAYFFSFLTLERCSAHYLLLGIQVGATGNPQNLKVPDVTQEEINRFTKDL